jgi:hypothetical protein
VSEVAAGEHVLGVALRRFVEKGVGAQGSEPGLLSGFVDACQHLGADSLEVPEAGGVASEVIALRHGEEEDVERRSPQAVEPDPQIADLGGQEPAIALRIALPPVAQQRRHVVRRGDEALGPGVSFVARPLQSLPHRLRGAGLQLPRPACRDLGRVLLGGPGKGRREPQGRGAHPLPFGVEEPQQLRPRIGLS